MSELIEDRANPLRKEEILKGLNPVQREAVLHESGPLLILAGAGSGKTRVITHRIAYLVECCRVAPWQILAITFTNKAANEMKTRLESLLGFASQSMWVGTFHSMMLRILRRHAELLGYRDGFAVVDTDEQERVIKAIMKSLNIDEKLLPVRMLQGRISAAKNSLQTWEEMEASAGHDIMTKQTAEIYRRYQEELKRGNAMDFDDILWESLKLLQQFSEVRESYQSRFAHVLVDEYQDTNHAQYNLVRILSSRHRNLCVVGDDDQSIYSFRGANLQNILDFERDFSPCRVIKLEQNYRSTATILSAANAVIRQNSERKDKKLWTDSGEGEKILFYRAGDHYDESRFISRSIRRIMNENKGKLLPGQVGILYRVNALSRNLEFALREEGIAYRIYGGLRFFDRKEIRDVLAYLRLIQSENDDLAFQRVVNVPRRGVGPATLEQINRIASEKGLSMLQVASRAVDYPELSRGKMSLLEFARCISDLRAIVQQNELSFPDFIEAVENRSGLMQELIDQGRQGTEDAVNRIENLKELISDAMEFESGLRADIAQVASYAARFDEMEIDDDPFRLPHSEDELTLTYILRQFVERSALYSDLDQNDEESSVSLMSIHSAKGLEFDELYIAGFDEGLFPGYRSMDTRKALEEERRLAYVAITRARKQLTICSARTRLLYGQTRPYTVSRFAKEIPDECVRELGGSRSGDSVFSQEEYVEQDSYRGGGTTSYSRGRDSASGFGNTGSGFSGGSGKGSTSPSQSFGRSVSTRADASRFSTTEAPARAKTGLDYRSLSPGEYLLHDKHGRGRLIRIDPCAGDAILSIDFDGMVKRFMANSGAVKKI